MNKGLTQGYIYNIIDIFKEELSIEKERELFFKAKNLCLDELFILESKTTGEIKDNLRNLRDFLEDSSINNKTLELIGKGFSRGYSYNKALDEYFKKIKSNELKNLVNNFHNIKDFMLIKMYSHRLEKLPKKDLIVVVDELTNFLLLNIPSNVKGIITKKEPFKPFLKTLVNEKDLSLVVSEKDFKNDTFVVLDMENNKILFEKKEISKPETKEYQKEGYKILLNVSSFNAVDEKTKELIDGIGIFKTECLFLSKGYVNKREQISIYKNILKEMYPKKVRIRLFDFKNDKKPYFLKENLTHAFNLFGCLYHLYEEQIEAMLYANEGLGNLEIIIPKVNEANEFRQAVEVVKTISENNQLKESLPKIGVMLGTKESFDKLSQFKDVGFMVINTNELSKELLNFNELDSSNYKNYTKSMIEIIKIISTFCRKKNIDYQIIGDMVNKEFSLSMLIQRQEKSFSIPKSFLNKVLEIINNT